MTTSKTGVLLTNLGSPSAPTTPAVRQFLRDFLGDPRVVNLPRPIWWLILHCFVLPFRPAKSAHAYQSIWDKEHGSPLTFYTRRLTEKMAAAMAESGIVVDYAMRYGEPSMATRLRQFKNQGINEIIILPLYPQYSSTTTASVYDDLIKELNRWRHLPSFQFISDYHQHPGYIAALADSIKKHWQERGRQQLLLMSFHGLPKQLIEWGDPYFDQCQKTGALLAEQLGLDDNQWRLVFQSRFGKAEWLKPYCVDTLQALPAEGISRVDVVCPGFAVDCLETLEEIAIANQAVFKAAGGLEYHYISALNDGEGHVKALTNLLERHF